jgi:chorismate mutase
VSLPPAVPPLRCLGVRGAITVEDNTAEAILDAAHELLAALIAANGIEPDDVGAVFFTTTRDVNAEYPAVAARQLGWNEVAILCSHEMDVPHGLSKCLRVLVMWNTTLAPRDIRHVYLRGAQSLRPDRASLSLSMRGSGEDSH